MPQQNSITATTARSVNFKGQDVISCPLCVSVYFSSQCLERITLEKADFFHVRFFGNHPKEDSVIEWFKGFLKGSPLSFPLPLLRPKQKPFTWKVWCELQKIPFGKTLSYREVAENANNPAAARAVGNACRINPYPIVVPCHRVLHADGSLGGFAFRPDVKLLLLNFENSFS